MDGLAGKNIRIGSLFSWLFGDISLVYLGFYIVVWGVIGRRIPKFNPSLFIHGRSPL